MANAKRASMREGPLAALFRKTEEGEDPAGPADDGESLEPGGRAPPARPRLRPPAARRPQCIRARAGCRTRR